MGYTLDKLKPYAEKIFSNLLDVNDDKITSDANQAILLLEIKNPDPVDDNYTLRLNNVLRKVKTVKGRPLCIKAIQNDYINAWAWDNNNIRITTGMMDLLLNDNELAAVIGHEIGHIVNGHCKKRSLNDKALALPAEYMNPRAGSIEKNVAKVVSSVYSRNHEIDADDFAFDFSIILGYSPYSMADALQRIIAQEGSEEVSMIEEFFMSHPDSVYREKRLRQKANARIKALEGDFDIE